MDETGNIESSTYVVLLAPEAATRFDAGMLGSALEAAKATAARRRFGLRALVCLTEPSEAGAAQALAIIASQLRERAVPAQWLLGSAVDPHLAGDGLRAIMPVGADSTDQKALALALSDLVIADSGETWLRERAGVLNKPIFPPGGEPGSMAISSRPVLALDPGTRRFGRIYQYIAGRFEAFWVTVLAFEPKRFFRLQGWFSGWAPRSGFPPESARRFSLEDAAGEAADEKARRDFAAFDRAAIYGARVHRDFLWALCVFTAIAAVFGQFGVAQRGGSDGVSQLTLIGHLVSLVFVAVLLPLVWSTRWRSRWIAARVGAEDLRIGQFLLPMMIAPPALTLPDVTPAEAAQALPGGVEALTHGADYRRIATNAAVRALRAVGLPSLSPEVDDARRAAWLGALIEDQIGYHRANRRRLLRADRHALYLMYVITALAFVEPVLETIVKVGWVFEDLGMPPSWIAALDAWIKGSRWETLIFTAMPAMLAAFHAASSRMGFANRAQLSLRVEDALVEVLGQLPRAPEGGWRRVRQLALAATQAMEDENQSWHTSMLRARDMPP